MSYGPPASEVWAPVLWVVCCRVVSLSDGFNYGPRGPRLKTIGYTLLAINMEVERSPLKTTILYIGPPMSFHVNMGEGTVN